MSDFFITFKQNTILKNGVLVSDMEPLFFYYDG